jgi:hypothetical protein
LVVEEPCHNFFLQKFQKPDLSGDTADMNFWLGTASNGVSGEPKSAAILADVNDEDEHKKKKKDKKEKKHKKEKKKKKEQDASADSYDSIANDSQYRPLASGKDLNLFYELRKVPLDPDKLAAAVQVHVCVDSELEIESLSGLKNQQPIFRAFFQGKISRKFFP